MNVEELRITHRVLREQMLRGDVTTSVYLALQAAAGFIASELLVLEDKVNA